MDRKELKNYVAKLIKRYGTADPFSLAQELNIIVLNVPLGPRGVSTIPPS